MFSKEKKAIDNHQAFRAILADLSTPFDYNGPLLFNIFMRDLSLILDKTYFAGYADDNTPYTMQKNANEIVKSLEEISKLVIEWFKATF